MEAASEQTTDEALAARQTTITAALFVCLGQSAFGWLQRSLGGPHLPWMCLSHAAVAGLIALLLWRRRTVDARWSLTAFLVLALPLLPMFWIAQAWAVTDEAHWQPFIGRKLILLGLALLTPYSLTVAALLVGLFMGESVLLWKYLDLGHSPIAAAAGEPWVTLVYFAATAFLVVHRWRGHRLEQQLLKARAEAEALGHLTQISLTVRDEVNTPLQTLDLAITLFKLHHPEERPTLERMSRSLNKLIELSRGLHTWSDEQRTARIRAARERGAKLERIEPMR